MIDPQATPTHPWIAEWVKVLIAAVVGFVSALILEVWKSNRAERRQIDDLERALYSEMTENYSDVRYAFKEYKDKAAAKQEKPDPSDWAHRAALTVKSHSVLNCYRYAELNPHLFYRIKHHASIRRIYLHLIKLHETDKDDRAVLTDVFRFIWSMTSAVKNDRLNLNLFKELAPEEYEDVHADVRESVNGHFPQWMEPGKAASQQ